MAEEQKKIEVDASELAAIIEQNRELVATIQRLTNQNAEETEFKGTRRKKVIKVTVATVDNKPVIAMVNKGDEDAPWYTWTERDPNNPRKEVMYCDLKVLDPKTKTTEIYERINWLEFMDKGGRKECEVKKQRGEEWYIENGVVTKREVPEGDNFHMEEVGFEVPDIVEGKEFTYVVDFNGDLVEIHERFVNMIK